MAVETIEAGYGAPVFLKAKQTLRVICPQGGQTGDLVAFRAGDITEWLCNGRSFDFGDSIYLTQGHTLFSNKCNPMLTIARDDVGRHDFLYAPCSQESFLIQHGEPQHRNCLTNIADALAHMGVAQHHVPTAFNVFMNSRVGEDGRLTIAPSLAKAGDAIEFTAQMDLAIALTACPTLSCNGGKLGPLQFEVLK